MILRREFLKRMAFAALATWFLDVPLPDDTWDEVSRVMQFAIYDETTDQLVFKGNEPSAIIGDGAAVTVTVA